MASFTIRNARKEDLPIISRIHIEAFPNFFLSKLGCRFLKTYYNQYLIRNEVLLVSTDSNDRPVGFIAGLNDSKGYYRGLKKGWYKFIFSISISMLNYKLIILCMRKALSVLRFSAVNKEVVIYEKFHELTAIGVQPSYQGSGIGRMLLSEHVRKMSLAGNVEGIFLVTDHSDNKKVHNFYESFGFVVSSTFKQGKDRIMSVYMLNFKKLRPIL